MVVSVCVPPSSQQQHQINQTKPTPRSGNRVTCRDWFQLTLKEGLTVFRDQQFSADVGSAAVKRIEDVR